MKTLSKLICRETLLTFSFNFAILSGLTCLIMARRFLREDIYLSDLFNLSPALLVSTFPFVLPLATLVTCCQVAARWKADGELLALTSAGLSLKTLTRPILLLFFFLCGFALCLNHSWAPQVYGYLRKQAENVLKHVFLAQAQSGLPLFLSAEERLFTGSSDETWIYDLTYTKHNDKETFILNAQKGRFVYQSGQFVIICHQVRVNHFSPLSARSYDIQQYTIPLDKKNKDFRDIDLQMTRSTSELRQSSAEQFEKAQRWNFSFLIPLFAWLGFKIGLLIPSPNKITAFFFALFPIVFIYFPLLMFFRSKILTIAWPAQTLQITLIALLLFGGILTKQIKKQGF